jgi:hypothetical protein
MSKLEDISSYIREALSKYIGAENNDDLKDRLVRDVANVINEARDKFDGVWDNGPPQVGDIVEVRDYQGLILEPDDLSKSPFDVNNGTITFTLMLPGNPLLVLATEGREPGQLRVMSVHTGETGWMHTKNLRPFEE